MRAGADPAALCEEILGEARRRAVALREEARRQGEAVLDEARREAERLRREAEDAARGDAARRAERGRAGVAIELRRRRDDRIEELLEQLRGRARRELAGLRGAAARDAVCALAAAALRQMDGAAFALTVAPDAGLGEGLGDEILRRAHAPDATLMVNIDPAMAEAGFLLRSAGGRQEWDGRLTARLDRLWPVLRMALARGAGLLEAEERRS